MGFVGAGCVRHSKHTADGSKAPVLVYGHMEPNMIVSFLGSVKAGRPYIPVDVSIPAERIVKIIESSGAELLISVSGDAVDTGSNLIKTVTPEELAADGDADLSRENWVKSWTHFTLFTRPAAREIRRACRYRLITCKASLTGSAGIFLWARVRHS